MARKTPFDFVQLSLQFVSCENNKEKYRLHPRDFTKTRKLGFKELSLFMLRTLRQNIQVEIKKYLEDIKGAISSFTSSALVQARKKISPAMFRDLNSAIAEDFYLDNDEVLELYKGHRILSIDGSTINLPVNADTAREYGLQFHGSTSPY